MSIFSSVPVTKLSRSTFNLDHENKLSFDFGGLYPILTRTVLPGDKMSLGVQNFVRTVPLLSPVMHRNDIKIDSFFVPMRLIWDNYEKWLQCTDDTIRMPKIKYSTAIGETQYDAFCGVGSLADYLGFASVPWSSLQAVSADASAREFCALPFRAYQIIYDFYYRNKSLEPALADYASIYGVGYDIRDNNDFTVQPTDPRNNALWYVKNRPWRRDVFTSALPDPQKGNPVALPSGDIVADGNFQLQEYDGTVPTSGDAKFNGATNELRDSSGVTLDYKKGLSIDPATIEDFRYAEVLEEYEEALARSGAGSSGTFKEWLMSIWQTLSPDARLDRPEYLGGYRGPIQISEVPQTSQGTATSSQGTLAGKGLSVGGNVLFKNKTFKEPGYLMVIMSVVPKSGYFQGDPREFLYESCFDFPNPYFANLGEQEVLTQEISATQALLNPNQQKTFGYNVRNYEMKSIPDGVHGALRSSLMYWHEGRYFDEVPTGGYGKVNLNESFVHVRKAEVNRIFPVLESSDKLIGEFFFNFRAKRSLPYYGVPRVGHTK